MNVIFVGDRPSKKNLDPNVAFVGTKSHVNLSGWILAMKVGSYLMVNSYTHADQVQVARLYSHGERVFVALGNNASKFLTRMGFDHYKLPHPSPRNRLLNSQEYVDSELHKCYLWLKEHKNVQDLRRV